jgi:hypothetical protein
MARIPPALRNPRYRLIWIGLFISVIGSQMQVATLLWQIRELTGTPNPLALGGVGLARFLPLMIFSLIGGTVADTLNRRWIIFISNPSWPWLPQFLPTLHLPGRLPSGISIY